jgi:hypothetical protein
MDREHVVLECPDVALPVGQQQGRGHRIRHSMLPVISRRGHRPTPTSVPK